MKTLIFDIGANRGTFTDVCLSRFTDLEIVTIEPNPELYEWLRNKYEKVNSVIVLPNVVSSVNDTLIDFYLADTDTISTAEMDWIASSRFSAESSWYGPIQIPSITIDSLVEKYGIPNLIKIDVEGYELEVLKGMTSKQKEICFEWAEEQYEKINQSCEHLKNIGYTEFGYIEGDDYLQKPNEYTSWEQSNFHNDINPKRMSKWGMIWAK
jgi:FkbM family methyltransferase